MPSKDKGKKKLIRVNPRMQQFLDGELKVEDLDDEEIRRGQFRSADGDFKGRPTQLIPRKFYDAVVRENIKRANRRFQEELEPSIQVLKDIAHNPRMHADARMKSAIFLIERAAGKTPEKSEVKVELAKWEEDIEGVLFEAPPKKEASE